MSGIVARTRKGMLAGLVLASLGFGATQALAAPPEASERASCIPEVCNAICEARYGPFAAGYCVDGVCECAV